MSTSHGFIIINKPEGISSYDCIRHLKKIIGTKEKFGHSGTLDPLADGIMIIAIGRNATKHLQQFQNLPKTYVVRAKLGELRDTLDKTGSLLCKETIKNISLTNVKHAISQLIGQQEQVPPIFSALKHEGKPLYKHVREGKMSQEKLIDITKAKKRKIEIYDIKLLEWSTPFLSFSARVTKGTYIRVLADDIAKKLGTRATTYTLCRTEVGPISLETAVSLKNLTSLATISQNTLPPANTFSLIQNYCYPTAKPEMQSIDK